MALAFLLGDLQQARGRRDYLGGLGDEFGMLITIGPSHGCEFTLLEVVEAKPLASELGLDGLEG
jgi:hypothetical protein